MTDKADKAQRLAAALRENLKKRKAQARQAGDPVCFPLRVGAAMTSSERHTSPVPAAELQGWFDLGVEHCKPERPLQDWRRGLDLLEQASAGGLAEASEYLAVYRCVGVGRPIDWPGAFDYLAAAAEQGSESARTQLTLLAGVPPQQLSCNYRALARTIGIDRLLEAPEVQLLSSSPRIGVVEEFASPAECKWLIDAVAPSLVPSTVYDQATAALRSDPQRTNRYSPLNPLAHGIVIEVIRARLSRTIGLPLGHFEASQVLHYAVGQEFKPHHDYFDASSAAFQSEIATKGQRIATQLIYLNDDYEGGETHFPSLGIGYQGRTGDALMFFNINERGQPEPLTLHSGIPPTSGEKWTFSQWIRDKRPERRS